MTDAPTLQWIGADTEPSDAFLDVLVEILWDAAIEADQDQGGDQDREGTAE